MAAIHRVGMLWGQSNMQGFGPDSGVDFGATTLASNAAVRFVYNDNLGESLTVGPVALITAGGNHFGPEQQIAARAVSQGWATGGNTFTILKWTHNGTPVAKFAPKNVCGNGATDGVDHYRLHRVMTLGRPAAADFRWYFASMQGESDCDTADGSLAQAQALGANHLALYNAIVARVGKAPVGGLVMGKIHVNVWGANQAVVGPWVPDGRASQVAIQAANPSLITLINNDSRTLYTQDDLHYMGASQHAFGNDIFDVWLSRDA